VPAVGDDLRAAFERNWAVARPLTEANREPMLQ
jgi:hypothetical protein